MFYKFFTKILLLLVKIYQYVISPLFPSVCRFTPTCSAYAKTALTNHKPFYAIILIIRRIAKCHPFGKYGYDPVPLVKTHKKDKLPNN